VTFRSWAYCPEYLEGELMDYSKIDIVNGEARKQMDACGAVYTNDIIDCIVKLAMKSVEYQTGLSISSCIEKVLISAGFVQSAAQIAV